jgi:hypothetical protein
VIELKKNTQNSPKAEAAPQLGLIKIFLEFALLLLPENNSQRPKLSSLSFLFQ